MKRWLVAAALAWPLVLTAATWSRVAEGHTGWADAIYLAASAICHQRPARSFHSAGVQWPVCGRCAGLYAAAPVGAVVALFLRRRPRDGNLKWWLVLAAVPTGATMAAEWLAGMAVTNETRFAAALSLGAAIAFTVVRMAPGRPVAIR